MKQKNTVEKTTFRNRLYVFVRVKTEFFQNDDVAISDPALISDSQGKDINNNCRKWNAFDLFKTFFSLQLNFASLNVRSRTKSLPEFLCMQYTNSSANICASNEYSQTNQFNKSRTMSKNCDNVNF